MDDECSELENDVWADINARLIRAERKSENLVLVAVREAVRATEKRARAKALEEAAARIQRRIRPERLLSGRLSEASESDYQRGLRMALGAVRSVPLF